ncbi:MAG: hypothetical protein JRF02_05850 [Deltaproteobacteria bacterium]|nr:hypothetical protein [Deltaproteobacteria bacterium]
MDSPEAVHDEILQILSLISSDFAAEPEPLRRVFSFVTDLYRGRMEEYQACNTDYHDLRHITDTYLAMARLLHGAHLSGEKFSNSDIILGLTGSLMHDTGLIQESSDTEGTGAKYTQDHVRLSMDFVERHADILQLDGQEVKDLGDMILCTDLPTDIPAINFSSQTIELLGKMLATADLIAQMADHTYLEKLLFLFHEFREGEVGNFKNEIDFLHHSLDFFKDSEERFTETLDNTRRFMLPHFKARWGIDKNLYVLSIENQRKFLEKIIADKDTSIYRELKRGNIVEQVRKKFGDTGLKK